MRKLTCYEWVVLALCGAFLLICFGWLFTRSTAAVKIETEHSAVNASSPSTSTHSVNTDGLLEGEIINLNTATRSDLLRLPNIGYAKAEAILAYRQEHGRFQTVDDLLNVHGIGVATLDILRPYLSAE